MRKRLLKFTAGLAGVLVLIVAIGAFWIRSQVAGSLPQLDGELVAAGLTANGTYFGGIGGSLWTFLGACFMNFVDFARRGCACRG